LRAEGGADVFERLTKLARLSLVGAEAEARALGHDYLGTEHQLLGILRLGDGVAFDVLDALELSYSRVRADISATVAADVDADALAAIGIDVEAVRRAAEDSFGPGALQRALAGPYRGYGKTPFTGGAKRVMELALGEALSLNHNYIGTEHLLLGLILEGEAVAAQVLRRLAPGADFRILVLDRLRTAS